ncbi:MAG: carotenoid oxygenase family protein [Sandaracinaceae bacterium]|nr:carotenoid oxygenase family protein [Sandaracinaceae bacterium]
MLHPRVPRSLLRTERTEHTALPLDVVDGALPPGLTGHLYVVAPASTVRVANDRTTLVVGDGLVSRFDLGTSGVTLTTRLVEGPDLVADAITAHDPALEPFRFRSAGMVRLGLLGSRNFANTALVPMSFGGAPARMLATYDAGRPVEIDPASLAYATPVGRRQEWDAEALPDAAFPTVLSPAHPAFDAHTGELFTLDYGRGVVNFAGTVPLVALLAELPRHLVLAADQMATVLGVDRAFAWLVRRLAELSTRLDLRAEDLIARFLPGFVPDSFTNLCVWDGGGPMRRYRLVLPSAREVHVAQSVHQVAVTREHVVFLETGFKIGLQSAFNNPLPRSDVLERAARLLLTRPQLPYTAFYVVSRAELAHPTLAPTRAGLPRVECRRVEVPLEADHFVADYDDASGQVVLHVAHAPATDLSEWIRPYDISAYDKRPIDPALHGMLAVGAMDVGRFGRYVLDGPRGALVSADVVTDEETCWALSLYAGQGLNTPAAPPERVESIYWCAVGAFPELLTEFVKDLYQDYEHRLVPVAAILRMGGVGRPSVIHRIETATMRFADRYVLPDGVMAGSLQFVPRGPGPTEGYLVGTVYTDARTELWVLDAADLGRGPLARLASPAWKVGFSLHTAWLPAVAPRTAAYHVAAREELAGPVARLSGTLAARFENELYPRFDAPV